MLPSTPQRFQIQITRPGQAPFKLSVHPLTLFLVLSTFLIAPLSFAGSKVYQLRQTNDQLSESAAEVLEELEVLDEEVEELRERAGLPKKALNSQTSQPQGGQGGVSIKLDPQEQLQFAKTQLPRLAYRLKQMVKPALEKTLQAEAARHAARPQGMPTKGVNPVSSNFGPRPGPFGGGYELHDGIDLLGNHGEPIYATATGRVERAEYSGGYGYHTMIKHGYGYETLYAHMTKLAVKPKQQVKRGQIIGYMGSTGRSTGTHLHYSIYLQGKAVDPKPYIVSKQYSGQQ